MPTIVFCSPKGGSGKTTSALLVANHLAEFYDVTLIDADPNRPMKEWATGGHAPARLHVLSDVDENNIVERIEAAATKTSVVIVDLEGTAAKIVLLALSQADFAVVPTQGSQLDAKESSRGNQGDQADTENDGQGPPLRSAAHAHEYRHPYPHSVAHSARIDRGRHSRSGNGTQ